jgi:cell shape-determining protein MreC
LQAPLEVPTPDDANYWALPARLSLEGSSGTVDVGSADGLRAGLGVYGPQGLIGIVDQVDVRSSSVTLLGSPNMSVRAVINIVDENDLVVRSGVFPEGSVHVTGGQLVFTPDADNLNPADLVGRRVVTAGDDSRLLQAKVPIGTISEPINTDGVVRYVLQPDVIPADGPVAILVLK